MNASNIKKLLERRMNIAYSLADQYQRLAADALTEHDKRSCHVTMSIERNIGHELKNIIREIETN